MSNVMDYNPLKMPLDCISSRVNFKNFLGGMPQTPHNEHAMHVECA